MRGGLIQAAAWSIFFTSHPTWNSTIRIILPGCWKPHGLLHLITFPQFEHHTQHPHANQTVYVLRNLFENIDLNESVGANALPMRSWKIIKCQRHPAIYFETLRDHRLTPLWQSVGHFGSICAKCKLIPTISTQMLRLSEHSFQVNLKTD